MSAHHHGLQVLEPPGDEPSVCMFKGDVSDLTGDALVLAAVFSDLTGDVSDLAGDARVDCESVC